MGHRGLRDRLPRKRRSAAGRAAIPYAGGDALAYASSGFLWDNALAHKQDAARCTASSCGPRSAGKTPAARAGPSFSDCYRDFVDSRGPRSKFGARPRSRSLEPYVCPTAIGFPSIVSDVYRADQFKRELKQFEADGKLPNLMIMLLPNDHTSGTRPRHAHARGAVADNDLALGQIVEAISHSKFWPETASSSSKTIRRRASTTSTGIAPWRMVISPYARRRGVDSTNYNQTSMVRTMELILGLPPMNQLDASATPMAACFSETPDLAPYEAVKNKFRSTG